jgi:hypothetical protein
MGGWPIEDDFFEPVGSFFVLMRIENRQIGLALVRKFSKTMIQFDPDGLHRILSSLNKLTVPTIHRPARKGTPVPGSGKACM